MRKKPRPQTEPLKDPFSLLLPQEPALSSVQAGNGWEKEAYATDIPSIPEPPCQRSLNRLPHSAQGKGASVGQVSFRGAVGTAAENPQRQRQ